MGNFDFVRQTLPQLHDDCARAESHLTNDPRSACMYGRRAIELLVEHLYDVLRLRTPYRDDLAAKINDPAFKARAGQGIVEKLNIIRRLGNDAVHKATSPTPREAFGVLREVFHVMVWAGLHHSPQPDAVPTGAQFDPALAAKSAPLTREQVQQLAARFRKQDEDHAKALADRDELAAAKDAEIAELRALIAAAQASAKPDDHDYDEAGTRDLKIDVLLKESGWRVLDRDAAAPFVSVASVEYRVEPLPAEHRGFADYVLWGSDGLPLAVIEAKRTRASAQTGQRQAELYAEALAAMHGRRPIIYYTNGYEHWLWDDASGYPPRQVAGFMTADELELAIQRRATRQPLASATVDSAIVERPYQVRAIKAVGAALDAKERTALLVMATGSGKTRTVIALAKQLQEYGWAKRILFLADRTALVRQAARAFRDHLPGSTTVNLLDDKTAEGRVYVATYPTMMNLIDEVDDGGRRFGPGHFDLIVVDEAHRSIYARYSAIFDYFDAVLVGLTATPKDEVDHNTYRLFHLEDGVPTDAYGLDDAVADGYLVPPRAYSMSTQFLRSGIRYDDLSEDEKDQWDALDWGDDGVIPGEITAGEINSLLYNDDTIDKVLETLVTRGYRVEGGDRIGKTIVFAANQRHAERIQERFDIAYPELAGRAARVITHASGPYAQTLIDDFSQPAKQPDIAISVDMLDTGIDVPEVVNLVFFKQVRSKSKFWQMIGRGTRLCPDLYGPGQDKRDFLVFDFCGNLEYFSQNLPGSEGRIQPSLSQRIFEARVALVGIVGQIDAALRESTVAQLRDAVAGMNPDNFVVRPHLRTVERFGSAEAWQNLTPDDVEAVSVLGGLPSAVRDNDEMAKRLDLLVLRHQLAALDGDREHTERLRVTMQEIAARLLTKTAIPAVAEQGVLLESLASDEWWVDVTVGMLEIARIRIRGLMRFLEPSGRDPVYADIEDVLGEAEEIALPGITPGMDFERFKSKAQVYLRAHEDHVALQRLRRGRPLTETDLDALTAMLVDAGAADSDIARARSQAGGLDAFIRGLVGLDREFVREAFERYLDGTAFTADQIRFVGLIVEELTRNGRMDAARLYESPYTDSAPTGPSALFADADLDEIVGIVRRLDAGSGPNAA